MGSLSPRTRLITGIRWAGRSRARTFSLAQPGRALARLASSRTMASLNSTGAWLMASVPPASTRSARPWAMSWAAQSMACMPEPLAPA